MVLWRTVEEEGNMNKDMRLVGIENVEGYSLAWGDSLYEMKPLPMLVEQVLPRQTITGLTSAPGTGKTWLAFELMRAIATGGRFLHHFQAAMGTVLFVGSDASIFDYASQWRRLTYPEWEKSTHIETIEAGDGVNDIRVMNEWCPLSDNTRFLIASDFMFENLDSVRKLIRTAKDFVWHVDTPKIMETERDGFDLIIFDTLSKMTRVNQNDNSEMEEVFRNLRLVAEETGAGILLLHHNARTNEYRDGESWRGASSADGALDNWIHINKDQTNPEGRLVVVKKFRGRTPHPFGYEMRVNSEGDTAVLKHVEPQTTNSFEKEIDQDIINLLSKKPDIWFTVQQLTRALFDETNQEFFGKDEVKFNQHLRNRLKLLVNSPTPLIKKTGGGSRGVKAEYSIIQREPVDQ
jgi:hypothetical protein